MRKNFSRHEQHQLQFRFRVFNFPNHPNWGNPDSNAAQPNRFGVVGGTRINLGNVPLDWKDIF